jgi:hypothetical protein
MGQIRHLLAAAFGGESRPCGATGGVVGGWVVVQQTTCLWATAIGGMRQCIGCRCRVGSRVSDDALMEIGIWEYMVVRWAVLSGERQQCNEQDTVEVVGERRWWDGPRGCRGLQRLGTTQWCNGRCCRVRGGGATDKGGGCSGVFVFYLHMGMGKIHWREEGDPSINRIKDRDIFLCMIYFFQYLFIGACFYLVWDVE